MILNILLDVDDTLNKFTMSALRYFTGRHDLTDADHPCPGDYDLIRAASALVGRPLTKPEFWDFFPRDFWASLPKSDEFDMILDFAESFGRENVCILTAPTIDPMCLAGKLDWIHENLPEWLHRQFLMGPRKHFCAHPQALLVDDANKNVNAFRAAGGKAVLVPRMWNTLYDTSTTPYLERKFAKYVPERSSVRPSRLSGTSLAV